MLIGYINRQDTNIPMAEIIRFRVAPTMRISEVCRLEWEDFDEQKKRIVVRDRT